MGNTLVCLPVDALGVNGLSLARGGEAIGFRILPLLPGNGRFDGKILIGHLHRLGPYAPSGTYNRVSFLVPVTTAAIRRCMRYEMYQENSIPVPEYGPGEAAEVVLEWCFDGLKACVRISADQAIDAMLLLNGCVQQALIRALGTEGGWAEQQKLAVHFAWSHAAEAPCIGENADALEAVLRGLLPATSVRGKSLGAVRVKIAPGQPFYVQMSEEAAGPAVPAEIDHALAEGHRILEANAMQSSGSAADCADAIARLVGYSAAYDTRKELRFIPVNRDWAGPNRLPSIFMWDNFFDSYLGCFSEPDLAMESLKHILSVISEHGIPGAPPQRNLVIPIVYSKLARTVGDEAFSRYSFPLMMEFMRFWFGDRGDGHPWRDGNDDGLIESGTCHSLADGSPPGRLISDAMDETGYDDSPMYSAGFGHQRLALLADGVEFDFDRSTLNLTMVGQNSLYVASCHSMAVLADELGAETDARWLRAEAERVANRIQERLYDPVRGIYLNRFFNGDFSPVKTMDIFSPITAGIADAPTAAKLHSILRDPTQFWGENVIPTVSYDDPAFGDEPFRGEYWQGNYWRGNIWAPTNYITYLALRKADWRETTLEFCAKSRRLFMDDWLEFHHANENYPPFGRTASTQMFCGNGGRDPHYIWAGLLPMMALEELFSVEDTEPGIRFGAAEPAAFGAWKRFRFHGEVSSVEADASGVKLNLGKILELETTSPVKFYAFQWGNGKITFRYRSPEGAALTIRRNGKSITVPLAASKEPVATEVAL